MYFCHLKTGKIYDFQGLCVMEATGEVGVMYQPFDSDTIIVRPATEFFDTERFKVIETEPGVTIGELQELYAESYPDKAVVSTWGDKEEPTLQPTAGKFSPATFEPSAGEDNIFVGDDDHFDITQEDPNPELDIEPQKLESASVMPRTHQVGIKPIVDNELHEPLVKHEAPRPATLQGIEKATTDG